MACIAASTSSCSRTSKACTAHCAAPRLRSTVLSSHALRSVPRMVAGMLKALTLEQYAERTAGSLSGGNKRKLQLACALGGSPAIACDFSCLIWLQNHHLFVANAELWMSQAREWIPSVAASCGRSWRAPRAAAPSSSPRTGSTACSCSLVRPCFFGFEVSF